MRWDLEEMIEGAIADLLRAGVNGELQVYAAWDFDKPAFPAAIVHCAGTGPVSEDAAWHDARKAIVQVAVVSEAAPETDEHGTVLIPTRKRNALARSKVLDVLCRSDFLTDLQAQIEAGDDPVAVSMAMVTGTDRQVDDDEGRLKTIITIETILEPVTGSV